MFGMEWLEPETLIQSFGAFAMIGVCLIVFIETGLLVGFFLPGDSLLFLLGLAIAADPQMLPIWLTAPLLFVCAFAGSQLSFELGLRVGLPLVERNRLWFLTPKVIAKSHAYFEKYGGRAVVLARFIPILRALVPVLAGISYLDRKTFIKYNLIGAAAWAVGMLLAGYWLGSVAWIREHLELTVLIVIIVTSLPFPLELLREWLRNRRERKTAFKSDGAN